MKIFNCQRCDKRLWTSYHKLPEGTVVCNDCYTIFLMQTLDKINENQAYDIIYNFVEKYQKKFPHELIKELTRLLELKYNIKVDIVTLNEILYIIKNKIEKEENIKKLAKFERELRGKDDHKTHYCEICNIKLPKSEFDYSMDHYGKPLCLTHQREKRASPHALKLYDALKKRGIDCELESFDEFKHFDITIKNAKLNIGIDGEHHSLDPNQIHLDLMRDEEALKKGYAIKRYTLREIDENLESIAETLSHVVDNRIRKVQNDEYLNLSEKKENKTEHGHKQDKKHETNSSKDHKGLTKL